MSPWFATPMAGIYPHSLRSLPFSAVSFFLGGRPRLLGTRTCAVAVSLDQIYNLKMTEQTYFFKLLNTVFIIQTQTNINL